MLEQIEKLKAEREKLTTEYKNNQSEYKSEVKRIDKAIRSFERGMNELNGNSSTVGRPGVANEIEKILREQASPLHLKKIVAELHARHYSNAYQSISGLMQNYVKAGKKFRKMAPATYGLIEDKTISESVPEEVETEEAK